MTEGATDLDLHKADVTTTLEQIQIGTTSLFCRSRSGRIPIMMYLHNSTQVTNSAIPALRTRVEFNNVA
jgi:hypothetical protein